MRRREFLKLSGTAALGTVVAPALGVALADRASAAEDPLTATVGNRMYRGTADGKIFVSDDGGSTWLLHTNFGDQIAVKSVKAGVAGAVGLVLAYQGLPFGLAMHVDRRSWLTTQEVIVEDTTAPTSTTAANPSGSTAPGATADGAPPASGQFTSENRPAADGAPTRNVNVSDAIRQLIPR